MIDITKQYRTRDGRPVRILCVDRKADFEIQVVGLVKEATGYESLYAWRSDGVFNETRDTEVDLVEVREKRRLQGFVNVYGSRAGTLWPSRELAENNRDSFEGRIACVPIDIEYEVGEGL